MSDEFTDIIKITFMVMLLFMGVATFVALESYYAGQAGLAKCKAFLQAHGYDFISYNPAFTGFFGFSHSNEECWGFKDGQSVRVY